VCFNKHTIMLCDHIYTVEVCLIHVNVSFKHHIRVIMILLLYVVLRHYVCIYNRRDSIAVNTICL